MLNLKSVLSLTYHGEEYWSLPYVHIVSLNTNNAPNVYTLELLLISFTALNYKHDYRLANYYAGRN